MKIRWKPFVICLAIPLIVGGLSSILTQNSMETFNALNQPPLSPPSWLFPIVWTILFLLMGLASYFVFVADVPQKQKSLSLTLYALQLVFNFLWTIIFFRLGQYLFAFLWLIVLWLLIAATLLSFFRISKKSGYLLLPYLLWVAFAGYLNLGIYLLN